MVLEPIRSANGPAIVQLLSAVHFSCSTRQSVSYFLTPPPYPHPQRYPQREFPHFKTEQNSICLRLIQHICWWHLTWHAKPATADHLGLVKQCHGQWLMTRRSSWHHCDLSPVKSARLDLTTTTCRTGQLFGSSGRPHSEKSKEYFRFIENYIYLYK